MIRFRKQRHKRSCGLACVSMIADVAYNTVLNDFEMLLNEHGHDLYWTMYNNRWVLDYSTSSDDLHYLLKYYGIKSNKNEKRYKLYDVARKEYLPKVAILSVARRRSSWHWVLWADERIYDPKIGPVPVDYWKNVWGYITVKSL